MNEIEIERQINLLKELIQAQQEMTKQRSKEIHIIKAMMQSHKRWMESIDMKIDRIKSENNEIKDKINLISGTLVQSGMF